MHLGCRARCSLAATAVAAAALAAAAGPPARAQSGSSQNCFGQISASDVPKHPRALRFGISPNVQTGQLVTGPQAPRIPEDPAKQLAALHRLAPGGQPLVLRLTRFFWSDGEAGVRHFLALANRYTSAGFLVELQLRYHPNSQQEGNIPAWTAFVREVVDRFGPNPRVVGIQVTNEVNLAISPDSSDGSFQGGEDALIQGVIAAKDEARRRGYGQLAIGFNWAYRNQPQADQSFWNYIRDHGGPKFLAALDWIGLDAYPGTFFPPADTPGGEGDAMVNAMSSLRCYARGAGIPDSVPMRIEENGYPTGSGRTYQRQVIAMDAMVGAAHDFAGTYDVTDYRWFNLRDSDSTSPNFQQQYGLLRDDYSEKPAFAEYRRLIAGDSVPREGPIAPGRSRSGIRLRVRCVRGRLRMSASVPGAHRVEFLLDGRRVARDRRKPFRRSIRGRRGRHVVAVRGEPGGATAARRVGTCVRSATRPRFAG